LAETLQTSTDPHAEGSVLIEVTSGHTQRTSDLQSLLVIALEGTTMAARDAGFYRLLAEDILGLVTGVAVNEL